MPLLYSPRVGALLMCDFGAGFKPPEMTKRRPVVVLAKPSDSTRLCVVVPLSTVAPATPKPFRHQMDPKSVPASLGAQPSWAKCDMLYTVSWERLDRVRVSKRKFGSVDVCAEDLDAIRLGVKKALNLA